VDVGATLAKLASRADDGSLSFRVLPSHGIERAAREVETLAPARLGLTGGGATALARHLSSLDTVPVGEFDAWWAGTRALLRRQGEPSGERDLLVSLGTGTAILFANAERAVRVGGTALGGGTLLGLSALLLGTASFDEVVALAAHGDRRRVDLLVSDVYPDGGLALPGHFNASSFAKLARPGAGAEPERADLAHALVGLVGENVAVLCGALAAATGATRIVFGGAALRGNAPLREVLAGLAALGRPLVFLADGEFAGAVGALLAAEEG
jgi:type II pantothenate kinase